MVGGTGIEPVTPFPVCGPSIVASSQLAQLGKAGKRGMKSEDLCNKLGSQNRFGKLLNVADDRFVVGGFNCPKPQSTSSRPLQ